MSDRMYSSFLLVVSSQVSVSCKQDYPYKADIYLPKWKLAPLKEGQEYAVNIWQKNIKTDLLCY